MHETRTPALVERPYIPHVLPFALFGVLTYAGPFMPFSPGISYLLKTVLVGASLLYFLGRYREEIRIASPWLALTSGTLVFLIWVLTDGLYPQIGGSSFNPYEYGTGFSLFAIVFFRMAGAVLVVPLMEELFWRSFAMRFVIEHDFKKIPLGTFTWFSFLVISVSFGFEHHHWLAGILAGMVYAGVLYRSKNLFVPILSHAVTNLLLGLYVLATHQWSFW